MLRWRGLDAVPSGWGRSVVTIGVFDGVHQGHQETIGHTVKRAHELGLPAVVVTFDPHPSEVVRPGSHPAVLSSPARKAELIEELGVDALCVIAFTMEFSHLSAEAFVHDVVVDRLHAASVVVGQNFRFGHRAAGDVELLYRLGRTFGFGVESAPLTGDDGTIFSSTYIRACVAAGDVARAAQALGRSHRLEGVVVRGDQRGRTLGFPTANLLTPPYAAVPADGVYAAWLVRAGGRGRDHSPSSEGPGADGPGIGGPGADGPGTDPGRAVAQVAGPGERLPAAVSIGTNPTFAGEQRRVEAYVLDFDGDLYGERVALDFAVRLREMRRYASAQPLVEQVRLDVAQTREALLRDSLLD